MTNIIRDYDWPLVARFCSGEATPEDLRVIEEWVKKDPGVKPDLERIKAGLSAPPKNGRLLIFDEQKAFIKLSQRLRKDKLI